VPGGFQSLLQDIAQLGFHRVSMLSGANAQPFLQNRVDIADRQRRCRDSLIIHAIIVHNEVV
jgi:hypothetical protein